MSDEAQKIMDEHTRKAADDQAALDESDFRHRSDTAWVGIMHSMMDTPIGNW